MDNNKSRAYINKKRKLKRKRKRRRIFFFALIVLIISFTLIKKARLRSDIIESANDTLNYYLEKTVSQSSQQWMRIKRFIPSINKI